MSLSRGEEGFSVLEAMVAIAILAAGLLPLLALQGQFVKTVNQIEFVEQNLSARDNALNFIKTVNLTETPTGKVIFDGYQIEYVAKPAAESRPARDNDGVPGGFELTLYDVELNILQTSGRNEKLSIRQFGWKATGSFLDGL